MKTKFIALLCIYLMLSSSLAVAQNPNEDSGINNYEEETGEAIIINVESIEPKVVVSSVLENQNTPVYVNLNGATLGGLISGKESPKISPLYGIPPIRLVNVKPADGITSQKANVNYIAPNKRQFLSENGFIDLGYLIVTLKKIPKESDIPDEIVLNLTADIRFELESGFGEFGEEDLVLNEEPDENSWKQDSKKQQKFWGGKGYVRASRINENDVSLTFYDSRLRTIGSLFFNREGDVKGPLNLRGDLQLYNYFRVKFRDVKSPQDKIVLNILKDGSVITRTLILNDRIYAGSNWRIIEIKEPKQLSADEKGFTNLREVIIRNDQGEIRNLRLKFSERFSQVVSNCFFSFIIGGSINALHITCSHACVLNFLYQSINCSNLLIFSYVFYQVGMLLN